MVRSRSPGAHVLDDFRRIVRVLRESARAAEQTVGVTGAQLFVLQALSAQPAFSLNEVADRTRTHQSTVSVVMKRLVDLGLVKRKPSPTDGRRIELSLTKAGRSLTDRAPDIAQERLIQGIERLPKGGQAQLARLLKALVEAMNIGDRTPGMFFEDEIQPFSNGKAKGKGRKTNGRS